MKNFFRIFMGMVIAVSISIMIPIISTAGSISEKKQTTRDIAIVFDNSGSMYLKGKKDWCQATYAIEVFSRMMNEGDALYVFPMNEIEVDGKSYTWDSPLIIKNSSEAAKIRNINTPDRNLSLDTHIETIPAALKSLKQSKADQQWLIVLTDGDEFYRDGQALGKGDKTKEALEEELGECANSVNTMYMGIGSVAVMPDINGKFGHAPVEAKNSADVPAKLSEMCNTIFGRNQLPDSNIHDSGRSIEFDIPLSKLIVFVQGEGIKINSLKDSSGKSIQSKTSAETKYSEKGAEHYKSVQGVDTTLQGVLVTYEGLEKGKYALDFDGQDSSIDYYYEPNVDLNVDIIDSDGISIFESGEMYSGDYKITYKLTEPGKTESLESVLLGKTDYDIQFTKNGEVIPMTVTDKAGEIPVTFDEGDVLGFKKAQVTFLNDYTISKTPDDLGFNSDGYTTSLRPAELKIGTGAVWELNTIRLSELEEKGVFELPLTYNGMSMTDEQIASVEIEPPVITGGEGEGNPVGKVIKDGNKIKIQLLYNEDQAAKTNIGDQEMLVKVNYTDEFGTNALGQFKTDFTVVEDTKLVTVESINIKDGKKYYLLKDLGKDAPLYLTIAVDGQPATDAELEAICAAPGNVVINTDDGFKVDEAGYKPVPGTSRIQTQILSKGTKKGNHGIKSTVTIPNTRNQVYRSEESKNNYVGIESIPKWMQLLIAAGILLLLAALVIWILNLKILPKKIWIEKNQTKLTSNGNKIVKFEPFGEKIGFFSRFSKEVSIDIKSAKDGNNKNTRIGLTIIPNSKIKDILFNRDGGEVLITRFNQTRSTKELKINRPTFRFDDKGHLITKQKGDQTANISIDARNLTPVRIIDPARNSDGKPSNLVFETKLNMRW